MAEIIYALCSLTSLTCATLLLRSYASNRTRLLFWASLCFLGLAINNILLFVDLVLVPSVDLTVFRGVTALVAIMLLLFGLIWDSK